MGAWGPAIFSDDYACDVRDDYIKYIIKGKSSEEATELVISKLLPEDQDDEELPVFWIALALTQWKKGRLLPEVKEKALYFIDNGADLERWIEGNQKSYQKRKEHLSKTRDTLQSPMPKAKKIPVPEWMKTDPWETGDLLSYKILMEDIEYKEYIGKYVLLRVVAMKCKNDYNAYHAYYLPYAWYGDEVPDPAMAQNLEYLKEEVYVGTPKYIYFIGEHIIFDKKDMKEHDIRLLKRDQNFRIEDDDFLRNGRLSGAVGGPKPFDYRIAMQLHGYYTTKDK